MTERLSKWGYAYINLEIKYNFSLKTLLRFFFSKFRLSGSYISFFRAEGLTKCCRQIIMKCFPLSRRMTFLHHAVHCAMFCCNANYRLLWLWGLMLSERSWKFFFALWWFHQIGSILPKLKRPLLKLSHKSKCIWRVFLHISVVE